MERTLALIAKAHQGDKEARNTLVEENIGLVYTIVRRFLGRGIEMEDLVQIGSIGLIKAIDKFDLSFEVRFSTYAVPMIAGEIKRFLRDDGMIKVSRSLKENALKVFTARERLEKRLGREPAMQELSEETGLSGEDIVMAIESATEVDSIYRTIYQGDGNAISLADRLEEKDLVRRTVSASDGRCRLLALTEAGEQFHDGFQKVQQQVNERLERGFSPEEKELFIDFLLRAAQNLSYEEEEQC